MNTLQNINDKHYTNKLPYASNKKNPKVHDAYYAEEVRLIRNFKNDLETEFKMQDHPKAELLYAKAWAQGHSSGLHEVYYAYSDLVELVK